jgi:tetratricopeptide (TPR) repeat protein
MWSRGVVLMFVGWMVGALAVGCATTKRLSDEQIAVLEAARPKASGLTPMQWVRRWIEETKPTIEVTEAETDWRHRLAVALEEEGEWRSAFEHWKVLREHRPNWWSAQLGFGECLHMMGGDLGEAAEALERALALRPETARALTLLGQLNEDNEAPLTAEQFYRRALALEPSVDAQLGLGRILQLDGRHLEAGAMLQSVLDTQGPQASVLLLLGQSQEASGAIREAEQSFLKAASLHPDPLRGKRYLYQFYNRQQMLQEASALAVEINVLTRSRQERRALRPLLPSKR